MLHNLAPLTASLRLKLHVFVFANIGRCYSNMGPAGALIVTLRRSAIGASRSQMATLNALGLKKKIGRVVECKSNTIEHMCRII